jgi:hypothetical protein
MANTMHNRIPPIPPPIIAPELFELDFESVLELGLGFELGLELGFSFELGLKLGVDIIYIYIYIFILMII